LVTFLQTGLHILTFHTEERQKCLVIIYAIFSVTLNWSVLVYVS